MAQALCKSAWCVQDESVRKAKQADQQRQGCSAAAYSCAHAASVLRRLPPRSTPRLEQEES